MASLISIIVILLVLIIFGIVTGNITIQPVRRICTFYDEDICPFIHDCHECDYYRSIDEIKDKHWR